MENILENLNTYGFLILFLYSFGGGMIALICAALLTTLNIHLAVLIAILGNFIGSSVMFYGVLFYKKDFFAYFKKHRRKLALGIVQFRRSSIFWMFFHKYVYGLKTIIPVAASLMGFHKIRFLILNAFSCILWGVFVGYGAWFLGKLVGVDKIVEKIKAMSGSNYFIILGAGILAILWIYLSVASKKRR